VTAVSLAPASIAPQELDRLVNAARAVVTEELSRRTGRPVGPGTLQSRLAEGLRELNAQLTHDRESRRSGYLSLPPLQLAYLAHHFPMHAAKVALLCREYLAERPVTSGPLRIMDVGAGPLSAAAGAVLALGGPAEIIAVDRATQMMKLGDLALKRMFSDVTTTLKTAGVRDVPQDMRLFKPHLTIAANVIGELTPPERQDFLMRAWDALEEGTHLLIVEPGTRIHSQGLVDAREALRLARRINILGPCMASVDCPLVGSRDWCHAEREAQFPKAYLEIARSAGLTPESLKFSHLWLAKLPPPKRATNILRIIGGPMTPDPRTVLRYACGPHGRVTLEAPPGGVLTTSPRGALVDITGLKQRAETPGKGPPSGNRSLEHRHGGPGRHSRRGPSRRPS